GVPVGRQAHHDVGAYAAGKFGKVDGTLRAELPIRRDDQGSPRGVLRGYLRDFGNLLIRQAIIMAVPGRQQNGPAASLDAGIDDRAQSLIIDFAIAAKRRADRRDGTGQSVAYLLPVIASRA